MFLKEVKGLEFIGFVICAFVGFIFGIFAEHRTHKTIGTLIVDRTDKDEPYLYLELDDPDWFKTLANDPYPSFRVRFKD